MLINRLMSKTVTIGDVYERNDNVKAESTDGITSQRIRGHNRSKSPRLPPVDINY